jgi:Leucine-rich repeat (LRR) protein
MKRLHFLLALWIVPFLLPGQSTPKEAAELFLTNKTGITNLYLTGTSQGTVWIYESQDARCYALVKNEPGYPVIAYSTENTFTKNGRIPDPAQMLLQQLNTHPSSRFMPKPGMKSGNEGMSHLIRTQWSQDDHFNFYCPRDAEGPGGRTLVGCVAVAIGQIVRYYGKNNVFNFNAELESGKYGMLTSQIGDYAWGSMENEPLDIDREASRFLFGMGIVTMMDYGPDFSTTSNYNAYDGLKQLKYFSANRILTGEMGMEATIQEVIENLKSSQPVYVSGSGHAFVCDGFDGGGMFHFNLGWGGYSDGYYPFDLLGLINIDNCITDLFPYSRVKPASNLRLEERNGSEVIAWDIPDNQAEIPNLFRVYTDDDNFLETSVPYFVVNQLPAGIHFVKVSCVYSQGESRWIGPVEVFIPGSNMAIQDPCLRNAILGEIQKFALESENNEIQSGEANRITNLTVKGACGSLEGIEILQGLQSLVIELDQPAGLDLTPILQLKRLKKLELTRVIPSNSGSLPALKGLVTLVMNEVPADQIISLESLSGLIDLEITGCELHNAGYISRMKDLRCLVLDGTGIDNLSFTSDLSNLETLLAPNNRISRSGWYNELTNISTLDFSGNELTDCGFLAYTPNLKYLKADSNRIRNLAVTKPLAHLRSVSLTNNQINNIKLDNILPDVVNLDLANNQIKSTQGMAGYLPALKKLNLHNNLINKWSGAFPNLTNLDLSGNKVCFPDLLTANTALVHLNLSGNGISDISKLDETEFLKRASFLDLTCNPLSTESFDLHTNHMKGMLDTLLIPAAPEALSPCYLRQDSTEYLTSRLAGISWSAGQLPDNGWFDVYAGQEPTEMKRVLTGITEDNAEFEITPGKRYYWSVTAITPDTCFTSGYGSFTSFTPVSLPFYEDFESYEYFTYLTDVCPWWISGPLSVNSGNDGRIERYKKYEGKQCLKVDNSSDIVLPIENTALKDLQVQQYVYLDEGRSACIMLGGVASTNLAAYFRSDGKVCIYFDELNQGVFDYPKGRWFLFQIRVLPDKKNICIKVDNKTVLTIIKTFKPGDLSVRELRYNWLNSPDAPDAGYPVFYIDKLEIKSLSTGIESDPMPVTAEMKTYPNPARDRVTVEHPAAGDQCRISVFDGTGRLASVERIMPGATVTQFNVGELEPGLYFLRLEGFPNPLSARLAVSR